MGDKVGRKHVKLDRKSLGTFVTIDEIVKHLKAMIDKNPAVMEAGGKLLAALESKEKDPWDE